MRRQSLIWLPFSILNISTKINHMNVEQVSLEGRFVKLKPLKKADSPALFDVGSDSKIWKWYPFNIETLDDMKGYVEDGLKEQKLGTQLPFVTIDKVSGKLAGSTRFMNIDAGNRRAEIGSTWLNEKWQQTHVNTEAKLLMLTHAFEVWNCIRVEFKTDALNGPSRAAILRLGAKEEGILRQHMITGSGRLRDSVYFSMLDSDWGKVKKELRKKLADK